jgi:hypothetical protein
MRKTEADMATKKKATKTEKPASTASELEALREYYDATHTNDGDRVAAAKAAVHKARGE